MLCQRERLWRRFTAKDDQVAHLEQAILIVTDRMCGLSHLRRHWKYKCWSNLKYTKCAVRKSDTRDQRRTNWSLNRHIYYRVRSYVLYGQNKLMKDWNLNYTIEKGKKGLTSGESWWSGRRLGVRSGRISAMWSAILLAIGTWARTLLTLSSGTRRSWLLVTGPKTKSNVITLFRREMTLLTSVFTL